MALPEADVRKQHHVGEIDHLMCVSTSSVDFESA